MNKATEARLANIFTALVAVIAVIQGTFLTNPPLSDSTIYTWGAVFTYLAMGLTAWKQYLSPDVANKGVTVTIWVAIIASLAGLTDLLGIFHFNEHVAQTVKWGISLLVTILNVMSKQFFPSYDQKVKMNDLKSKDGNS